MFRHRIQKWMISEVITGKTDKILIQYKDDNDYDVIPRDFIHMGYWFEGRPYTIIVDKSIINNIVKTIHITDINDERGLSIITGYLNHKMND